MYKKKRIVSLKHFVQEGKRMIHIIRSFCLFNNDKFSDTILLFSFICQTVDIWINGRMFICFEWWTVIIFWIWGGKQIHFRSYETIAGIFVFWRRRCCCCTLIIIIVSSTCNWNIFTHFLLGFFNAHIRWRNIRSDASATASPHHPSRRRWPRRQQQCHE